jgi:Tfp pilus assembly protein PilZ
MPMDNEKRVEKRLEKKLLVNINKGGLESMGLTTNISKTGMFIATTEMLPINSEVQILIGIADETYAVKGLIIWSQEWKNEASNDVQAAIGVRILEAPPQYLNYVEKVNTQRN